MKSWGPRFQARHFSCLCPFRPELQVLESSWKAETQHSMLGKWVCKHPATSRETNSVDFMCIGGPAVTRSEAPHCHGRRFGDSISGGPGHKLVRLGALLGSVLSGSNLNNLTNNNLPKVAAGRRDRFGILKPIGLRAGVHTVC